jgi:hypothetical protein
MTLLVNRNDDNLEGKIWAVMKENYERGFLRDVHQSGGLGAKYCLPCTLYHGLRNLLQRPARGPTRTNKR